jgi:uncharacterized protein YndB with AHSA1/START domain
MPTSTIRLHRVIRAAPERVYRAFLDPEALAKWIPPNGFTGKVHHMDARVGGTYKMSFTNFGASKSHSFGGTYVELTPHQRIRYTDTFDDPNLPGEMNVTITLKKVSCGTELSIVQEGVPEVIPPEACYLGWQESLVLLAKLVEAEIPGLSGPNGPGLRSMLLNRLEYALMNNPLRAVVRRHVEGRFGVRPSASDGVT